MTKPWLDIRDAQTGVDFDAEGFELLFGADGEVLGITRQDVLLTFDEDHARAWRGRCGGSRGA
jgi:hypothetical protein